METEQKVYFGNGARLLFKRLSPCSKIIHGIVGLLITINLNVYANSGKKVISSAEGNTTSLPTATNVTFTGFVGKDQTLTGSYNYNDADGDLESGSTYQWYVRYITSASADTGYYAIPGATSLTYTIDGWSGYSIAFSVTPKNASETGEEVISEMQGPIAGDFAGGAGESFNPYQINQAYQLNNVRDHYSDYFELTADIDLSEATGDSTGAFWHNGDGWQPIPSFSGFFDGKGFRIKGLHINRDSTFQNMGLFDENSGTITNLILEDVSFGQADDLYASSGYNVGALVAANKGTITNCSMTGNINGFYNTVGGLVGRNDGSGSSEFPMIILSHADVTINSSKSGYAGGLVGENTNSSISESYSMGSVHSGGVPREYPGGGSVGTREGATGGLVGAVQVSGSVSNSFSTADVDGAEKAGGLVGWVFEDGEILNSYSVGAVTSSDSESLIGGFIGLFISETATATGNFWDTETSGISTASSSGTGAGTGKTTAEMQTESTFTDASWDFTNTWAFESNHNNGYPSIQGNVSNIVPSVSNVTFTGDLRYEGVLTASYTYSDSEVDAESGTTFQWYQTVKYAGLMDYKDIIDGATSSTYTLTDDDAGSYISVKVIPYDGFDKGISFESETKGPIGGEFAGGTGSSGDPYQINEAYQLDNVRNHLNNYFKLTADIDLSDETGTSGGMYWNDGKGWEPYGVFSGDFDGNGYAINGLYIARASTSNVGFFSSTIGTVHDLGLTNVDVKGYFSSGGIVGNMNPGSTVTRSYVTGKVSGNGSVGGVAGLSAGSVTMSYSTANISGDLAVGGLVGTATGYIANGYYTIGQVSGDNRTGGIAGHSSATIDKSYSTGTVADGAAGALAVGGLVGWDQGTTTNSYWNTEISGLSSTGGGGTGLTSAQMMDLDNFENFDFENVWDDNAGFSFPVLRDVVNQVTSRTQLTGSEGWRLMSSPLSGISYGQLLDSLWTQGFTGADYEGGTSNVYTWNEANQQFESISDASNIPEAGKGFIVYVYDDQDNDETAEGFPKTLLIEGNQMEGAATPTLSYTDTGDSNNDGWNLVGNPYAFPLNWAASSGWTQTNIDASFYVWNASAGEYQSHNGLAGTLPDSIIAPGQGFWVKANGTNPALSLNHDVRGEGGVLLKKASVPQLKLQLEGGELSSKATVMFSELAELGKDPYDAYKLAPLTVTHVSLSTLLDTLAAMDIQALPLEFDLIELELDIKGSALEGNFSLSWEQLAIPENWAVHLHDRKTEEQIDMSQKAAYEFTMDSVASKVRNPENSLIPTKPVRVLTKNKTEQPRLVIRITSTSTTVSNEPGLDLPTSVELQQNYPNPFNPSTTIAFGLPQSGKVTLEVFDVLGRKVATLLNGQNKTAGRYTVNFDARNLASGMYIYRLQAGNTVITKKLTLIK